MVPSSRKTKQAASKKPGIPTFQPHSDMIDLSCTDVHWEGKSLLWTSLGVDEGLEEVWEGIFLKKILRFGGLKW